MFSTELHSTKIIRKNKIHQYENNHLETTRIKVSFNKKKKR